MKNIIIQTVLLFACSISFGQQKGAIISLPNIDDYHSLRYVESHVDELSSQYKDSTVTILIDAIGLFEIKGFDKEVKFDTILFYCPQQYNLIKNILAKKNVTLYGTSITSSMLDYLRNTDSIKYNQLDSISRNESNKSFESLFITKMLIDYPSVVNVLVSNFNIDSFEKRILLNWIQNSNEKIVDPMSDSTFASMLGQLDYFLWVHEWTYEPRFKDMARINIIPHKLRIDEINSVAHTNKLKNAYGTMNYAALKNEQLPRKIKINDFRKVKRKNISGYKNIYIKTTSSCKSN